MGFNLLFWRQSNEEETETVELISAPIRGCKCGSGLAFKDCHAIEFALPDHERPDPD